MKNIKGIRPAISLKDGPFIELFRIEDIDDSLFNNYQRYDFYQLLWFTDVVGNKSYFIDFEEYPLKGNSVILLFPGQIDRLDVEGVKGFLFAIEETVFFDIGRRLNSDFLNGYYSSVFVSPDSFTKKNLETLTGLMLEEHERDKRLPLLRSYAEAFLYYISSLFEHTELYKRDISGHVIGSLMRLIDNNFIEQRETDFYANRLGVSQKRLNLLSIKGTGKTVKQHLQERLVLEIKKEIRLGDKNLKEIAFALNFSEPAYFTRFFKLHTGITPTQFKESG